MKAIGHTTACPVTADNALIELDIDKPQPGPRDLLVRVRAVSVNPVDVKVRELMASDGSHRVLGYDAAGVVEAVGAEVTLFQVSDLKARVRPQRDRINEKARSSAVLPSGQVNISLSDTIS